MGKNIINSKVFRSIIIFTVYTVFFCVQLCFNVNISNYSQHTSVSSLKPIQQAVNVKFSLGTKQSNNKSKQHLNKRFENITCEFAPELPYAEAIVYTAILVNYPNYQSSLHSLIVDHYSLRGPPFDLSLV